MLPALSKVIVDEVITHRRPDGDWTEVIQTLVASVDERRVPG
ncbi:MAG TPA: hypothetical protein VNZ26_28220 [Vicinamibacterales bacterium]|nr:hypothetical protein [Vicinamibacterales bacterium]